MQFEEQLEKPGYRSQAVVKHQGETTTCVLDTVAEEFPVALVFNGISHAVMMATPRDLKPFAAGFSLTEGIVLELSEIFDIDVFMHDESAEVFLRIGQRAFFELKEKRRALAGRTGCGICGIESIDLLDLRPARIERSEQDIRVDKAALEKVTSGLSLYQSLMQITGGVHAAAWCDRNGEILRVFEDVGRHNSLDKLVGALALDKANMRDGFVFLSSRASYELVRKAARVNIHTVATISAPTSLAIDIAERAGVNLISFCRSDGFVEYVKS